MQAALNANTDKGAGLKGLFLIRQTSIRLTSTANLSNENFEKNIHSNCVQNTQKTNHSVINSLDIPRQTFSLKVYVKVFLLNLCSALY